MKTIIRAVRGISLMPIILSRILFRLHLLFKFEIKIISQIQFKSSLKLNLGNLKIT